VKIKFPALLLLSFFLVSAVSAKTAPIIVHTLKKGETFSSVVKTYMASSGLTNPSDRQYSDAFRSIELLNPNSQNLTRLKPGQRVNLPLELMLKNRKPAADPVKATLLQTTVRASSHKWGAGVSYSFFSLANRQQPNTFTSEVLSDLSPGFQFSYQYDLSRKISIGGLAAYKRVQFKTADLNNLNNTAANFLEFGTYGVYSLAAFLDAKLELGYETSVYLRSVSNGNADIDSLMRPYAMLLVSPKVSRFINQTDLSLFIDVGFKQSFQGSSDGVEVAANGASIFGLRIEKRIANREYGVSLQYHKSNFDVDSVKQNMEMLQLSAHLSFGGLR